LLFFKQKFLVLSLVVFCHLFSVFLPASAGMQNAVHAVNNNEDLVPLCTGTGLKWISLSNYYQTGKIIFVELPQGNNDESQPNNRSLCLLFNVLDDNDSIVSFSTHLIRLDDFIQVLFVNESSKKHAITLSQARAPPLFY
jgi:hypothetical protein